MADKHRPTPWHIVRAAGKQAIFDATGLIATISGRFVDGKRCDAANAALIVRAVNHHEELVEGLKALMEDYEDNTVGDLGDEDLNVPLALKNARAVLAKVEASDA